MPFPSTLPYAIAFSLTFMMLFGGCAEDPQSQRENQLAQLEDQRRQIDEQMRQVEKRVERQTAQLESMIQMATGEKNDTDDSTKMKLLIPSIVILGLVTAGLAWYFGWHRKRTSNSG